jgi:hypothetical protein
MAARLHLRTAMQSHERLALLPPPPSHAHMVLATFGMMQHRLQEAILRSWTRVTRMAGALIPRQASYVERTATLEPPARPWTPSFVEAVLASLRVHALSPPRRSAVLGNERPTTAEMKQLA